MTTARFPEYPIEVRFPDLLPYMAGNTGIPYVHTFAAETDGPHVMINALTHGNEVCGAIVVKALLDLGLRPRRGKLSLSFANVEAYQRFDPLHPDAARFVDQDLNRVWTRAVLDDNLHDSSELRRARAMLPVIDTVDLLLDIHSMHERSAPLIVSGALPKGIALARQLHIPRHVISDAGHPEGRRLRDYDAFGASASEKNALLIECGQHWESASVEVAKHSTARFLLLAGAIERGDLPDDWWADAADASVVIEVTQPVVASNMDFRFAGAYTGLETFAEPGTVIGWDNGQPVRTPYPDCVLVMPSLRQLRAGVTVVRFGRIVN